MSKKVVNFNATSETECYLIEYYQKKIDKWQLNYSNHWIVAFFKSDFFFKLAEKYFKEGKTFLVDAPAWLPVSEFNHPEKVKIYLREQRAKFMYWLLGRLFFTSLDEVSFLQALSDFADTCIFFSAAFCQRFYAKREDKDYGNFLVIALGKLGGQELNFSSDIDLMFTYQDKAGFLATDANDYFTKVAKLFVQLLNEQNAHGLVYRVDLRLRPFGSQGPLVLSVKALETYYQEHGRAWERYALQKARVITGDENDKTAIMDIITPFVYRKYLDYSVLEALRNLKSTISREVQQKTLEKDIKRGLGGIREVEFICQSLQLIHGGRNEVLRDNGLLKSIDNLLSFNLLSEKEGLELKNAYLFFRTLENRLQILEDKQTHAIPTQKEKEIRIAYAMGFDTLDAFCHAITKKREYVHFMFLSLASINIDGLSNTTQKNLSEIGTLWQQQISKTAAIDILSKLGFENPEHSWQIIKNFSNSKRVLRLSQMAKLRLDKFIPILLMEFSDIDKVDETFSRFLNLLEKIVKRSQYLALLLENSQALKKTVSLFSKSEKIADLVTQKPYLLEMLLEERLDELSLKNRLAFSAKSTLLSLDKEDFLQELRIIKYRILLQIAYLEVERDISSIKASFYLSVLASHIVQLLVRYLAQSFCQLNISDQFLVVAYGRLAGGEMSYESDLDLIFLYSGEEKSHDDFIKFVKKIIYYLSLSTHQGILYQVDSRLRPSGSSGLLVSHISQFSDYQSKQAWTWEHQALIRAKPIFASSTLEKIFYQIRYKALSQKRDLKALKNDILEMRKKIALNKSVLKAPVKLEKGGLIDLEFILQFLVLKNPGSSKDLRRVCGVLSQVEYLFNKGCISENEKEVFLLCFEKFKQVEQFLALHLDCQIRLLDYQSKIQALWQKFFA